ncbi:TetR/AcrR family transcriptional regulator [Streptacidiphilus melanogenes]|uniref:TetR/AcrR family transcriptional regulator n=1 Tax=Streptacidiphilus melanogenes TaxID=411235 RepID=UPI0005A66113|nr:TetR/AcrR family transcriptional regulator [Streptacidiphilus melanogenes]
MTDQRPKRPATASRSDKRRRLLNAAAQLLHQQGVERTTLAEIAQLAAVPTGGVYYYFKTKDDVIAAVIDAHAEQMQAGFAGIEAGHHDPKSRLKALVREFAAQHELIAQFGCPLGTLCSELDKRDEEPSPAADLMHLPIAWAEQQYQALGRDDAHELALDLMAAYEGSALLANTMRDPQILTSAARRIAAAIDAL